MAVTVRDLVRMKQNGERFVMLTAYDYQTAQIFDDAGIPLIFIGDTLGIFVLGHDTTIPVTMEAMIHHCRAVTRAVRKAMVVGDLPFGAYHVSDEQGVANAIRLMQDGNVHVVKLEGPQVSLIERLTSMGVAVMGHLGLTPQSYYELGGNVVQARSREAATQLVEDARAVERAGACALVLEAVPVDAAREVTDALSIPTIGIGAGPHCDGQVLVSTEMLGLTSSDDHSPRYAKRYADLRAEIHRAACTFADEVATGTYPDASHAYDWALKT